MPLPYTMWQDMCSTGSANQLLISSYVYIPKSLKSRTKIRLLIQCNLSERTWKYTDKLTWYYEADKTIRIYQNNNAWYNKNVVHISRNYRKLGLLAIREYSLLSFEML